MYFRAPRLVFSIRGSFVISHALSEYLMCVIGNERIQVKRKKKTRFVLLKFILMGNRIKGPKPKFIAS